MRTANPVRMTRAEFAYDIPTGKAGGMITVAHYGGIDEIAVFVVPAVAVIVLLRWAERRARARAENEDESLTSEPAEVDAQHRPLSSWPDE